MNRLLLPLALIASTAACATILDFQDPTDRVMAEDGVDAKAPDGTTSTTTFSTNSTSSSSSTSSTSSSGETSTPITPPPDAAVVADDDAGADADADAAPDATFSTTECSCTPHAPTEWRGPYVMAEQAGAAPDCLGDYPVTAYTGRSGLAAEPAQCSCSCGDPAGVACSPPSTSFFTDATCSTPACHVDANRHSCNDSMLCDIASKKVLGVTFGTSTPSGGKCEPSATARVPAASSTSSIRLCAPLAIAKDCAGGICQPTPSPLFDTNNRCIVHDGDVPACPSSYPARRVYYSGGSDTRACSQCQCDAPTGVACNATAGTSKDGACKDPTAIVTPSACVPIPTGGRVLTTAGTPSGGSCSPTGGQAIGTFDPGVATTICCLE